MAASANSLRAASVRSEEEVLRTIEISDLVKQYPSSVRLRNSIAVAARSGALPFRTIGEYLDAGPSAHEAMMRLVPNMGLKSARELDALVTRKAQGHLRVIEPIETASSAGLDQEFNRSELLGHFATYTCFSVVDGELPSVRLSNVLERSDLLDRSLEEVLQHFTETCASMLRYENCGRKSVNEFRTLCERFVARTLSERGFESPSLSRAVAAVFGRGVHIATPEEGTDLQSSWASADAIAAINVPHHSTLRERIDWLLAELDERASEVIRRRYGIDFDEPETLEEVGTRFRVTRERIRQIESKSLRKLRARIRRAPLEDLLAAQAGSEWNVLTGGRQILGALHRSQLSPEVHLALDIIDVQPQDWLRKIALELPYGWLHAQGDADRVNEVASAVEATLLARPIPRSVGDLGMDATLEEVEAACELVLGRRVYGGYLVPARVGARLSRALGLHALLATHQSRVPVPTLLTEYHTCFPRDLCSGRDAEIVMEAAPHLFLEIEEDSWVAVGPAGPAPLAKTQEPLTIEPRVEEPGTIAFALQSTLRERGPTRLGDLLELAPSILPPGRSVNSIGPVLLTRKELFVRALPGVYALPEHIPGGGHASEQSLSALLNEQQARLYALARYAGEPITTFPYWSFEAEYELCRWARHSADRQVFASLLKVASIQRWPLDERDKGEWLFCKENEGRFELGSALRQHVAYRIPELDRVLAALIYSLETGSLNWMAANRLTGRQLDSHGGAALLIVLLQLGALEESGANGFKWQLAHSVTGAATGLRDRLQEELSRTGQLTWDSKLGAQLAATVVECTRTGWVDPVSVQKMFESGGSSFAIEDSEDADPVERLFAAHRKEKDAERREATLRWLLEE